MFDLAGRVALVTGAGQNVGAAIASRLAACGAAVVVNDLAEDRADGVAATIRNQGGRAIGVGADITQPAAVAAMVERAESELGAVDVLVNNAGIPASGIALRRFVETTPGEWDPFVRLNLYGVLYCTHALLPSMCARGWGRIVTIVSDAGRIGEPGQAVYAASKAAAAGFMKSIAKEVGRDGVTCNSVSLGSIDRADVERDPELLAKQLKFYPMRRLGVPDDIAAAVVWLASPEAGWVTGQTVPVNGGYATS